MAPAPLDCAGSLLPVTHLQPGDQVRCDFCGRDVYVRPPPPEGFRDPWPSSKAPRISLHWAKPMKEMKPGN